MKWMALVVVMSVTPLSAASQAEPPKLSRTERAALQAIVTAVDTSRATAVTPDADWPIHVLRASDGSHYVAFSVPAAGLTPARPVVLYVRLATRTDERLGTERSAVAEWLAGERSNPVPPQRGIAFGEMPTYGAGAIAARGPGPQSLQLLEMERERARERQVARDRERKATLEGSGAARAANALLPFEDFDLKALATANAAGAPVLRRSLTAGPGEYELIVAWVDPTARNAATAVQVMKRALSLPTASTTEFALSSVIVADEVAVRETTFPPHEQTAHPYSIGGTEITPAEDEVLTNDDRLAIVVQVINARPTTSGKPDVVVGFRLSRLVPGGTESVGTVNPQYYNHSTLPAEFDGLKGHPLFAAVAIPLRTFKRGTYRLQVLADDRAAGSSATSETTFRVIATPAALLRDAPPLGGSFQRESLLETRALQALVKALRPASPSSTLARALDAAAERRFVELIQGDPVASSEVGVQTALRGLALYGLGDTPTAVCAQFRQALQQSAPPATVQVFLGACRALEHNDREAVAAWEAALGAGLPRHAIAVPLAAAHLRLGNVDRAGEMAAAALAADPSDAATIRVAAAPAIAAGRFAEAASLLEAHLAKNHDDVEAQWLLLHTLFASAVRGEGPGATATGSERFKQLAQSYIAQRGRHAPLAAEWLASR
jgi:hypothetical protein